MTDYYLMITRVIASDTQSQNSSEARHALYEQARQVLDEQLRHVVPALSKSEIALEKLALDVAIRRYETMSGRKIGEPHEKLDFASAKGQQDSRADSTSSQQISPPPTAGPAKDRSSRPHTFLIKAKALAMGLVFGRSTRQTPARSKPEQVHRSFDTFRINLSWRDIQSSLLRFILTVAGVCAIVTATVGINGLYRGIVFESLLLIENIGADLWVVQGGRAGPFAESSTVPDGIVRRLEGVAGVREARRFVYFSKQFDILGRRMSIGIAGLDFPRDNGQWVPLIDGRYLETSHFEAIADQSLGFVIGDTFRLGKDDYTIVGITSGQVDFGGDGLLFVSVRDAQAIDAFSPSEAILLNRAARRTGDAIPGAHVAAVIVELNPSADMAAIRRFIASWGDVNVVSRAEQRDILLNSRLWRLRIQILAFVMTMFVVAGVVISLTIYTMTLEKLHSIAILKLIGARDSVIVWMTVQISLFIGTFAFAYAVIISLLLYPHFPRLILILPTDLFLFFCILQIICMLASIFGILKARSVRAQEVLS